MSQNSQTEKPAKDARTTDSFNAQACTNREYVQYFTDLRADSFNAKEFRDAWNALADKDLSLGMMVRMLDGTAKLFRHMSNLGRKSELKDFLDDNMQIWIDHAEGKTFEKLTPNALASAAWALSTINVWPGREFMGKWALAAGRFACPESHKSFDAYQTSQIIHALCLFDAQYEQFDMTDTIDYMLNMLEEFRGLKDAQRQIYQDACNWIGRDAILDPAKGNQTVSRSEEKIADLLRLAGADLAKGKYITSSDLSHIVDIPLLWKGRPVLVEYDGPSHFNRAPNHRKGEDLTRFNSSTAFQTRLLRTLHPDVHILRFRYTEFKEIQSLPASEQLKTIRSMMDGLVQGNDPDCYVSDKIDGNFTTRPLKTRPKRVVAGPDTVAANSNAMQTSDSQDGPLFNPVAGLG